MTENTGWFIISATRPKPPENEVRMPRSWEKSQAVYAPMLTNPVARANVVVSFVCGLAEPCSLFGGKVATLLLGYIEELPLGLRGPHNGSNFLNYYAKYGPQGSIWRVPFRVRVTYECRSFWSNPAI